MLKGRPPPHANFQHLTSVDALSPAARAAKGATKGKPKMKMCPDCGVKRREGDDYERHRLVHLPKKSTKKAGAK